MKNIAVVMGGYSAEKIVSMKSGSVIMSHLDKNKFHAYKIVIENKNWKLIEDKREYLIDKSDFSATIENKKIHFDGVFIAIHGIPGENGELQEYLDKLKIPYTNSGKKAAQLSFDKGKCNNYLRAKNILCANSIIISKSDSISNQEIINQVSLPCFVKPNSNGSSFGISKVSSETELSTAIEKAFKFDNKIIIESFLDGIEVTCGIHNFNSLLETFPITEIVSENDFFDYQAKYEGKSKEITPARIDTKISKKVSEQTKKIYSLLGLDGIARIDFIIVNNEPYLIEANTVPGLSKESIIPQQAKKAGINLKDLFSLCLEHIF